MAEAPTTSLDALRKLTDAGYAFYRDTARQRNDDLFVRALPWIGFVVFVVLMWMNFK